MIIDLDKIYEQLARKHGISKVQAEVICRSMFEIVRDTMREKKKENISTPFGKFVVPDRTKYAKVLPNS